jgi:hypothetical protein
LHVTYIGYHHEWLPPAVLLFSHSTHALACHHLPLVSPEHSNDGEEESRALDGSEHFSQAPHYTHDDKIDASPCLHLNDVHDSEDVVSAISNTKEFYEEQDEKENVIVRSKKLFLLLSKPFKPGSTTMSHCGWSLLQDIMKTPIPPLTNISCQLPKLHHTHKCTCNVVQNYKS